MVVNWPPPPGGETVHTAAPVVLARRSGARRPAQREKVRTIVHLRAPEESRTRDPGPPGVQDRVPRIIAPGCIPATCEGGRLAEGPVAREEGGSCGTRSRWRAS